MTAGWLFAVGAVLMGAALLVVAVKITLTAPYDRVRSVGFREGYRVGHDAGYRKGWNEAREDDPDDPDPGDEAIKADPTNVVAFGRAA